MSTVPFVRVELDVVVGEGRARKLEPGLPVEPDVLVSGLRCDEHDDVVAELLLRRTRELDVPVVRWVEGAAEKRRH